jgi:uncharacterized protein
LDFGLGRRNLHPDLSAEDRRRLFLDGIDLFNQGRFYESHEVWEEIWRSTTPEPRDLFQGLVQVAAAMHQFLDLKRDAGPGRTLAKARAHLEPLAPTSHGLDIADLLRSVGVWEDWLQRRAGDPPPVPTLKILDLAAIA